MFRLVKHTSTLSQRAKLLVAASNSFRKISSFQPLVLNSLTRQPADVRQFHVSSVVQAAHQPFTIKSVRERLLLTLSLYDKIDPEKLTLDSDFFKDLGLDSLDFVEVIMAIEDEFMFEIPDGHADRFKTPRDIFQFICDKEDVYE
ncbi:unnamed protein product [Bursaphelenchus xylophilus]|uniref:Acyl carrier protein n=1 Tax=Bursaphelenchus xylophilus TaxID=6326 RepID=A0A1I7S4Y5_BURXY|nr:unnamed protein product [Bursaphelenchus xylophilus]CAG9117503.1 unnamed protein product [Bursaphelenchus xylophilus]